MASTHCIVTWILLYHVSESFKKTPPEVIDIAQK